MPFLDEIGLSRLVTNIKNKFATKDVATSTKDGLMSSADKSRLDGINDETTGINLVRGSRDFTRGTIPIKTSSNTKVDGFYIEPTALLSVDEEGFTIVNVFSESGWKFWIHTNVIPVEPGDTITISFDFMWSKVSSVNCIGHINAYTAETIDGMGSDTLQNSTGYGDQSYSSFGLKSASELNVWHKAIKRLVIPENIHFLTVQLGSYGSADNYFRKIKIEHGSINNPIWSASPFDIDYINDYTTGINLLRGTKDFSIGSQSVNQYTFKDGWNNRSNYTFYKDSEGYTVAKIYDDKSTSPQGYALFSSAIYGLNSGDTVTISGEIMVDDVDKMTSMGPMASFNLFSDSGNRKQFVDLTFVNSIGDNIESGKWYKFRYIHPIKWAVDDNDYFQFRTYLSQQGSLNYRKIKVELGAINNPIWSPSPFDIDRINDETTGINLIRGTRDFVGREPVASGYYPSLTGFNKDFLNRWFTRSEEDGFTVITSHKNGDVNEKRYVYSSPTDYDPTAYYTVSCEIKVDSAAGFKSRSPISLIYLTDAYYEAKVESITVPSSVDIKDDEWFTFTHTFKPSASYKHLCFTLRVDLNDTTEISFKKLRLYKGRINNPIWSASPFDVAQVADIATPTETLNYIKGLSATSATIPLPSEGFLLEGLNTPKDETEGDDDAWQMM